MALLPVTATLTHGRACGGDPGGVVLSDGSIPGSSADASAPV